MTSLDLSGADLKGFEPIPAGSYNCTVFSAEMGETSGEGKTPAGTPKLNVRFRVSDEPYENRALWGNYVIPPDDYEKAPQLKGMFVRFLTALGYDEKKIVSGKFNLDLEDLAGRECVVTVKVEKKYRGEPGEMTNVVTGVKAAGSSTTGSGGSRLT